MPSTCLVYASRSELVEMDCGSGIDRIIASASKLNAQNDVIGCLMVTPTRFAQVLEGRKANVAETYGRIVVEPRHRSISLRSREPTAARRFP